MLFAAVFSIQVADVLTDDKENGKLGGVADVIAGVGQATLGVVAITYCVVEGTVMLAEIYKRTKFKEGKAEGKAEQDRVWRNWFETNKDKLGALDPPPPPNNAD